MDIDQIIEIIPKRVINWNRQDVGLWLRVIQLESFQKTQNRWKKTYQITGILTCYHFESYIQNHQEKNQQLYQVNNVGIAFLHNNQSYIAQQLQNYSVYSPSFHSQFLSETQTFLHQNEENYQYSSLTKRFQQDQKSKSESEQQHDKLYIYEKIEGSHRFFICQGENLSIGKAASNNIVCIQRYVEMRHCEIIHSNHQHYLISKSKGEGVWKQIIKKSKIQTNTHVEIGNTYLTLSPDMHIIHIEVFTDIYTQTIFHFDGFEQQSIKIGRKNNCQISFPHDTTMSGFHCKIYYNGLGWQFEDLASTNGSWIKCQEQELITDKFCFRLGRSKAQFQCRVWKNDHCISESSESTYIGTCKKCKRNQKNTYFKPCFHHYCCSECAINVGICELCEKQIQTVVKIYKQ